MDELLFISMAKMGAGRRQLSALQRQDLTSDSSPNSDPCQLIRRSESTAPLAVISLALALSLSAALGAAAWNSWSAARATTPAGEVSITELTGTELSGEGSAEFQVAQSNATAVHHR